MNQVTQTPLNKADATSLKGKTLKWRIVTEVFWLVYLSQTSFRVHVSNCCIVFHYVWFWFQDFTAIEVLCYTKAIKHKQLRCQLTLERIQFMLSDRRDSPVRFPARRTEAFALVILFIIRGKNLCHKLLNNPNCHLPTRTYFLFPKCPSTFSFVSEELHGQKHKFLHKFTKKYTQHLLCAMRYFTSFILII